ncbi:ABC transporter substrate-binding protein [Streptomyces sp. NPDC001508]|uniref:ABC transporter substrate-binding protein n=1 Tax=Streptomyces sp. NPDC001508 TaxID=3154656 RepID=UPI0033216B2D
MKHIRVRGTVAAALALTIALGASACAPSSSSRSSAPSATSPSKPTTIQYWHINTKAFGADAVNKLISDFNKTHTNITVEGRFYDGYSNLLTALQTSVAAGDAPAVAQIGYSRIKYVASTFPYVSMADLGVDTSGYRKPTLALGQAGGKQAGLPYGLSALEVYYNAGLLKKAGLDPEALPTTWDGWQAAAKQMKSKLNVPLINFQQFTGDNYIPLAMVAGNGGTVLSCVNGSPKAAFNSEKGVQAIGLMGDLAKHGLATNLSSDQALQAFLGGKTATLITASSSRANLEAQSKFALGATQFPTFGNQARKIPAGGNALFSFAQSDDQKIAAREFIDYIATKDSSVTTYVKGTGYLPALKGAAETYTKSNVLQQEASKTLPAVVPWVSFPGPKGLQASQVMYDATQAIMGGTQSAQQALDDAAGRIDGDLAGSTCD